MNSFNQIFDTYGGWLQNDYIKAYLLLVLMFYSYLLAPKLPPVVENSLKNSVVQFLAAFLVVYLQTKNATLALICAVVLMFIVLITNDWVLGNNPIDETINGTKNVVNSGVRLAENGLIYAGNGLSSLEEGTMSIGSNLIGGAKTATNFTVGELELLINGTMNLVRPETQKSLQEVKVATLEGQLHPAEAQQIVKNIVQAEQYKSQSQQSLEEDEVAYNYPKSYNHSKDYPKDYSKDYSKDYPKPLAQQEMQMLAHEVMKQAGTYEASSGKKMSNDDLKYLCKKVEYDYRMRNIEELTGVDEYAGFPDYAPVHHRHY